MADIMVNLAALPDLEPILSEQRMKGIEIRQGKLTEREKIVSWVRLHCNPSWAIACEDALEQEPISCYIAVLKEQSDAQASYSENLSSEKQIGIACFDVTTRGVVGPICVLDEYEETRVETALLLMCLHAMTAQNYKTAVIGWGSFIDGSKGKLQQLQQ